MPDDAQKKTVLIIDDDEDFCHYLKMILDESGFCAVSLTDTAKGIDYLKMQKPDIITLDLMMPGEINGIKLFRFLRTMEEWKCIPVIIVSGMTSQEICECLDYKKILDSPTIPKPEAFLEKPVEPIKLINEVRRLTGYNPTANQGLTI